jgi:hypothetical protein
LVDSVCFAIISATNVLVNNWYSIN